MDNVEKIVREYDRVCKRLIDGEYDDIFSEIRKFKELEKKLDKLGVKFLDGLTLDSLVLPEGVDIEELKSKFEN